MRTAAILALLSWAVAATFQDDAVKSPELAIEPVGKALNNGVIDLRYTPVGGLSG